MFYGIVPPLVTPMTEEGDVNIPVLKRLVRRLIQAGVHGLFAVGSSGEAYALSLEEKKVVGEAVLEAAEGKVPVMIGAGAPTTREAVTLAEMAKALGAQAISVVTPYFVAPHQGELYQHFRAISEVGIPMYLYNQPLRTGVPIHPETVGRLAREGRAKGIKDSSADLATTMSFIQAGGADFTVLAGNDSLILGSLVMGAKGAVAGSANLVPELVVGIYEAYQKGDLERARQLQYRLHPLRQAFRLGTFPAMLKEGLELLGIPVGPPRLPATRLTASERQQLQELLDWVQKEQG